MNSRIARKIVTQGNQDSYSQSQVNEAYQKYGMQPPKVKEEPTPKHQYGVAIARKEARKAQYAARREAQAVIRRNLQAAADEAALKDLVLRGFAKKLQESADIFQDRALVLVRPSEDRNAMEVQYKGQNVTLPVGATRDQIEDAFRQLSQAADEAGEVVDEVVDAAEATPDHTRLRGLQGLSVTELKDLAKEKGLRGYSKLAKADLISALEGQE